MLAGCRSSNQTVSGNQNQSSDTIKIAFYPNESAAEFEPARKAVKAVIEKATDKKVELVTSTDYNVVVESIANGQVDLAYMGAEGYIEANKKNEQVEAILTNSGPSGTLEDALYYSF
ncbi:MetQ/NlpA family ABC transporter substrate-binding protein [Enterococcus faecium]|nr:MetQ/NlpA family ABC transporter substrate-binding protein [Enterococcus faecium]